MWVLNTKYSIVQTLKVFVKIKFKGEYKSIQDRTLKRQYSRLQTPKVFVKNKR